MPKLYFFSLDSIQSDTQSINGPFGDQMKLRIISFNLGGRIQTNQAEGSERPLVELCRQEYPRTQGWSNIGKGIYRLSQCTFNAVTWLSEQNADLIGLQEVAPQYLTSMMNIFNQRGQSYSYLGSSSTYFIYNNERLGLGTLISPEGLSVGQPWRPMIVVWFPKVKLLAINLHAEHYIPLKETIEATYRSIDLPIDIIPKRIVLTGDFNDAYRKFPKKELHLMNFVLKEHRVSGSIESCCTDSQYRYLGDYIFDSKYYAPGFYGIPANARNQIKYDSTGRPNLSQNATVKLMSDHDPVVFYES